MNFSTKKNLSLTIFIFKAQFLKLLERHLFIRQKPWKIHVPILKIFCMANEYILYIITRRTNLIENMLLFFSMYLLHLSEKLGWRALTFHLNKQRIWGIISQTFDHEHETQCTEHWILAPPKILNLFSQPFYHNNQITCYIVTLFEIIFVIPKM